MESSTSAGAAKFNPSITDAWPSSPEWQASRWLRSYANAFIQPLYSERKRQARGRTRSRCRRYFPSRYSENAELQNNSAVPCSTNTPRERSAPRPKPDKKKEK
jgi:hypothetical protein